MQKKVPERNWRMSNAEEGRVPREEKNYAYQAKEEVF